MENLDEVRKYIETDLHEMIDTLEKRRIMFMKHHYFTYAFALSVLLHFPVLFVEDRLVGRILFQFVLITNLVLSYLAFFYFRNDERFYYDFKRRVYPRLLSLIDETLHYRTKGRIKAREFVLSGLYYGNIKKLRMTDVVMGRIKRSVFAISFISARSTRFGITRNSERNTGGEYIFNGLHCIIKVPMEFKGKAMILPKNLTGSKSIDEINRMNIELRTEAKNTKPYLSRNSDFDNKFQVFSTSTEGVAGFLTEKRIEQILTIERSFKNTISLSFFDNLLFMQAHTEDNIFRPKINEPINTELIIQCYLNLAIALNSAKILLQ